jgi:phosphonoacetaldehyde hydrolase
MDQRSLRGVIFDWAGTTVDFGSRAPVAALLALFSSRGIQIHDEQARAPMGLHKRDHIRALLDMPDVTAKWQLHHGRAWADADVERMYQDLLPLMRAAAREHATLIPGVAELCAELRRRGLPIGSTTGYSTEMMAEISPLAAAQGYKPDAMVTVSDVPAGRPAPWMCFRNAERLGIYPMAAIVKIGDTVSDIAEGLYAGMWTVGLSRCGNEVGLSATELSALPPAQQQSRIAQAERKLTGAGAHYVVEEPAAVLDVLARIEERLQKGERP